MDYYSDPEVILSKDCRLESLVFYGNKCLGDTVLGIDLTEVTDIFCKSESDRQDLLSNKLARLSNKSGFIHVSNGTSYRVMKGFIKEIVLRGMSLGQLSTLKSEHIKSRCGDADAIDDEMDDFAGPFGPEKCADIYVYQDRGLRIHIDIETHRIRKVCLELR